MDAVVPTKDNIQLLCSSALVINGHGSKTVNNSIDIENHILLTPHRLEVPYVLSMEFSIESHLRQGFLPAVHNGGWTAYGLRYGTSHAPNVIIQPWSDGELLSFSRQISNDPELWSKIDGVSGYYCERDTSMCLILRTPDGTLSYLDWRMSAKCFEEIGANRQLTGTLDFLHKSGKGQGGKGKGFVLSPSPIKMSPFSQLLQKTLLQEVYSRAMCQSSSTLRRSRK